MRCVTVVGMLAAVSCFVVAAPQAGAAPSVSFVIILDTNTPPTGAQSWLRLLSQSGATNVQIRQGRGNDLFEIKNLGTDASPSYRVTGLLTRSNTLKIPGREFRLGDSRTIAKWIDDLQVEGIEGLTAVPAAFGLSSKQLVELHDELSRPNTFITKGKKCAVVVEALIKQLNVDVVKHKSATAQLASDETVAEEMHNMSIGTSLAAALRPLGLVAVPHRQRGGKTRVYIVDSRNSQESWPVGWPSDKSPTKTLPVMYDFLAVEIKDFKLNEALDALQKRIKVPFLYDHNSMARHGVDLSAVKVSLPEGRTYYKKIISRLLQQAKPERMKAEVRVDEAGNPFLWITTIKQ